MHLLLLKIFLPIEGIEISQGITFVTVFLKQFPHDFTWSLDTFHSYLPMEYASATSVKWQEH
jgi:hypothetical protein